MAKCQCGKRASFGPPGGKPVTCKPHSENGYIDLVHKKCEYPGCKTQANHGDPDIKKKIHCAKHASNGEIDITHKKCEYPGCKTQANHGDPNTKKKVHCAKHANLGENNIVSKKCEYPGCKTQANHGDPGTKKKVHCAKHANLGEINIVSKNCEYPGCETRAIYGNPGTKKGIHCVIHANPGEIDVKNKKCKHPECDILACYGDPDNRKKIHCAKHAAPGEINVVSKKCEYPGCKTQANHGDPDIKKKIHCAKHANFGETDVKNKKCEYSGCETRAHYGKLFESKNHCAKHKQPNEFKEHKPKCHFPDCENRPTHSQNNYPNSCETHALPGETNIIERPCVSCKLEYFIPSSRDTCDYCYNNPDRSGTPGVITTRKLKESAIKSLLTRENIHFESHDKIIENSCSRYRPDFVIDTPYYKIVVEVDEFQHRVYGETCEHNRMMQVMFDSGMEQILFIRYNPDKYYDDSGVECDTRPREREDHLIRVLRGYMNPEVPLSDPGVSIVYLYYDGYDGTPEIGKVLKYE